MTLTLHTGANSVSYDELRAVVTPAATDTHVLVPHHEIVELMRFALGFHEHEIAEEHHAITLDGARYFAVLCLRSPYGGVHGHAGAAQQSPQVSADRHCVRLWRVRLRQPRFLCRPRYPP